MNSAQRLRVIKRIATHLAETDWAEVRLVLREFGVTAKSPWEDEPLRDYVLRCLEDTSDETLRELDDYARSPGDDSPPEAPSLWQPGLFRLFISHTSQNKRAVSATKTKLRHYGIAGFVAHQDIEPTKEWVEQIELALETCDALAAFMTPDFHDSKWTDQEVGYCIKRRVLILPVRLGTDPYGFFGRYQALTPSVQPPRASLLAREIFDILVKHELTAGRIAEAIVTDFEQSDSWDEAKTNAKLLQEVKQWTPALLARLDAALEANDQIKSAYGVPEKIRAIIAKAAK